jgi:6-pyruvoyltetrahydropterin/6-carboxytetrahydropterin synthase
MTTQATRYHDISVGHRVAGHESKCRHLHGHNYRVHFSVEAPELDSVGRVMDFSVIKERLCMWLEDNWDHKFLAWDNDPLMRKVCGMVHKSVTTETEADASDMLMGSIVLVPFNPTAENMAEYLVETVGPTMLFGTGVTLVSVVIEETRKCSCTYTKKG